MMNRFLLTGILLIFTLVSSATDKFQQDDFERFKSQKIAFISEKLNLTTAEAQAFWPVYNEMENEKMELQRKRRNWEERAGNEEVKMSDQEIVRTTRQIIASMKKEAELVESYHEKFLTILPPQKVLLLFRAENQFRAHMFEQYRRRRMNNP